MYGSPLGPKGCTNNAQIEVLWQMVRKCAPKQKCWGANGGRLGSSDSDNKYISEATAVDLGTGRTAKEKENDFKAQSIQDDA